MNILRRANFDFQSLSICYCSLPSIKIPQIINAEEIKAVDNSDINIHAKIKIICNFTPYNKVCRGN